MKISIPLFLLAGLLLASCTDKPTAPTTTPTSSISKENVAAVVESLKLAHPTLDVALAEKGVTQAASLWHSTDGTAEQFKLFCEECYLADATMRQQLFTKLSSAFESVWGNFHRIEVDLKLPMHMDGDELTAIDHVLGGFDVSAHFTDDMFANKVAFITVLNFPSYTLEEKTTLAGKWSRLDWAYARMGDVFTSRIPAGIQQEVSETLTASDTYISEYNIMMGKLLNSEGKSLFPEDMKLISHWNLRDELKSNYANKENGIEKQQMIYTVMKRIITQEIPEIVVNNPAVQWNPIDNKVYKDGAEVVATSEPNTRYRYLLNNYKVLKAIDVYTPQYPTYIQRAFDGAMEMSKEDVERIFTEFVSSPQVKEVAELIKVRLGRELQPFDIWYDGFKSRSSISEDDLNAKSRKLYPNASALEADLPNLLKKLGFSDAEAKRICSKIQVDASRGAGHAWGAEMRGDKARLRSRIKADGLDYKGFNIGVHEFGHNVEQTISLYDVDYYMMQGVPNTAFTEALAFVFQKRDLDLLGMPQVDPNKEHMLALDIFWGCYEIMGVSLVDMRVWEWMYANPAATEAELKDNVVRIAKEVWNSYFEPVLGEHDCPLLAIYSHMIDNPLYLSNYPMGHLIEFQLEEHLKGKSFAAEVVRIYSLGRLTPQEWMKQAVGSEVSSQPVLRAAAIAVEALKK